MPKPLNIAIWFGFCSQDAKVITITDMKTVVPEVKDTEYAIRLSVTDPIADFHQRVPDMAYKVSQLYINRVC